MCENNVVDEYQHPSHSLLYTPWNIPGPGIDIQEFEAQLVTGCDCKNGVCNSEGTCECISRFGQNYCERGYLLETKINGPVVECNSSCACFERGRCGNRVVQFGPLKHLQIFSTRNGEKGFGLKCDREINRGAFICEYAGEVIGLEEAKLRTNMSRGMNYVFVLNEHLHDGRLLRTCVDPTAIGNIGRYINHSCDPNSSVIPVRIDSPVSKLCIFASRALEAGEEITFDYGGGLKEKGSSNHPDNRKICLCGSEKCTKYLPFDCDLL